MDTQSDIHPADIATKSCCRDRLYFIENPPLMEIVWPVIQEQRSEQRKTIILATSPTSPRRLMVYICSHFFSNSGVRKAVIGV